jgi:hypothetical protein
LIQWHFDQEAQAVGSGLRSSVHSRTRRKGQPLRDAALEGGTGCVHRHGKHLRGKWRRVEDDLPAGTTPGLPTRPDAPVYFRATETNGLSGSNVRFAIVRANTGGGTYSASTGVYTVPVGGYYAVHYSVGWSPGATTGGRACAYVLVPAPIAQGLHGGSCAPLVGTGGTTNVFTALTGSTIVPLNAGDTIAVQSDMNGTATLGSSASNGLVVMKLR